MKKRKYSDGQKIYTPCNKSKPSADSVAARGHLCEYSRNRHKRAAEVEHSVYHQQRSEPLIRLVLRLYRKSREEGRKCHYTVTEQVVVEDKPVLIEF